MRTAVIGTGIMGAGMAGSLARAGHDVTVWNRTADKAAAVADAAGDRATAASSVAEAVRDADVVLTALFDEAATVAVADELVAALRPDAVWLQTATVGPAGAQRLAALAPDRFLDAPVLGTRKPAEDGALVVLLSGPAQLRSRVAPVLEAIGARTLLVGDEPGPASALKLAANSWVGIVNAGAAQAITMTRALGVDPALFLEAIRGGAVDTPYAHVKGKAILEGSDAVSFALDGVIKDMGLMIEAAEGAAFDPDLLRAVMGLYERASERGHGAEDMAAVHHAFTPGDGS